MLHYRTVLDRRVHVSFASCGSTYIQNIVGQFSTVNTTKWSADDIKQWNNKPYEQNPGKSYFFDDPYNRPFDHFSWRQPAARRHGNLVSQSPTFRGHNPFFAHPSSCGS